MDFPFDRKTVLVTYHPETLDAIPVEEQFRNLLEALDDRQDIRILFTLPNSDTGGRIIVRMIEEFVARNKQRARAYTSLGQLRYLSALRFVARSCREFFQRHIGGTFFRETDVGHRQSSKRPVGGE